MKGRCLTLRCLPLVFVLQDIPTNRVIKGNATRLGVEVDAERTCSLISDLRRAGHAPSCQTMEKWRLETILSSGLLVES